MGPPRAKQGPTKEEIAQAAFIRDLINRVKSAMNTADPSSKADRAARLKELEKFVDQQIQINLTAWQEQADSAITDARPPTEEKSRVYFWVALAGNLVWAATCFLNPAGEIAGGLIVIMSVTGATVGSGSVQQVFDDDDSPPDDPKVLIRQMLAKKRGELEDYFKGSRKSWAATLDGYEMWDGDDPEHLLDEFNKFIWDSMFPTIPFNANRFDAIRSTFLKVIESTLADFNRQWKEYRERAAWFGEAERKKRGIYFHPILKIRWGDKLISGVAHEEGPQYVGGKFY